MWCCARLLLHERRQLVVLILSEFVPRTFYQGLVHAGQTQLDGTDATSGVSTWGIIDRSPTCTPSSIAVRLQGGYPLGDKAALVADVYLRTVATMDKLRETLRDEHSFLIQVDAQRKARGCHRGSRGDCTLCTAA